MGYNYIISQGFSYLGIVFTDFIGETVIAKSISLNTGKFTPCPAALLTQGCTYCSNSGQCLGCNTTTNYVYDAATFSCLAAPSFYLDWTTASINSALACNSSIPGCQLCTSASVCTSCDVLANYELISNFCEAAPYYYLDNSSIPVVCTLTGCYRCDSNTICTECSAPNNYILNNSTLTCECNAAGLFVQHPSADACICQIGYFISSNNTCEPMPLCPANGSGCVTCNIGPPNSCALCDASGFF